MTDIISYSNFFESTTANFIEIHETPDSEPDYISYKFNSLKYDAEGNEIHTVSSRYWYGRDERGAYVIRESDHWSYKGQSLPICPIDAIARRRMQANVWTRLTPISSCFWLLKTNDRSYGVKIGKAYISDFSKLN
jgi:hypothetical protein